MANILIVDDSKFMRGILKKILTGKGHHIAGEASDGIEAFREYVKHKPDLVFMDITMPNMNGISALEKIMKIDKDARIVICSAMGQQAFVMEAIELGAKDFIVKPFNEEIILNSIERFAKKAER